ncbi:amelogenin, X isoform [Pelodytes ibericus]
MKSWLMFTSLLVAAFSLPLPPHPQHPGYVNFSYEILTPLKWYQTMMKHQYPSYGYEPMSGWLQNPLVPIAPLMPQQQLPHQHAMPKLPSHHPILIPQQPMIPVPPHHPMMPPPHQTHQLNPTFLTKPNNQPLEPPKPDQSNLPGQLYPIQPQPPFVEERPHDPWQSPSKTKQEELMELLIYLTSFCTTSHITSRIDCEGSDLPEDEPNNLVLKACNNNLLSNKWNNFNPTYFLLSTANTDESSLWDSITKTVFRFKSVNAPHETHECDVIVMPVWYFIHNLK